MAEEEEKSESSSSSADESEQSDQTETTNEVVNIDFEARSPEESDLPSIQRLLSQLFQEGSGIDLRELSNVIISQNYVGAVIFQPEDDGPQEEESNTDSEEDIFGITTVINITSRKNEKPVQELMEFLKKRYEDRQEAREGKTKFELLFNNKAGKVGWIINERFINMPAQIAPKLFESLKKDMTDAAVKSMPYLFDSYLLIAKAHIPKGGSISNPLFVNEEEEFLFNDALATFSWSCGKGKDPASATAEWKNKKDQQLVPVRIAMLLDPSKFDKNILDFQKLFAI